MADKRLAMQVADGEVPDRCLDAATRAEAQAFRDLSLRVRAASVPAGGPPDFDAFFAGVEARVDAEARQAAGARGAEDAADEGFLTGLWHVLAGRRPLWLLAPAGALLMAATLSWVLLSGGEARPDNTCFVDSYDVDQGSVVIDQDPDDPDKATVIWLLEEG